MVQVLRDIETGMSRRMAYVSFKSESDMFDALEEMHKAVRREERSVRFTRIISYFAVTNTQIIEGHETAFNAT
jgi:RNA recognition motif-containing protein